MKKNKILCVMMFGFLLLISTFVYADVPTNPTGGTVPNNIKTTSNNLWATISYVVQIISIACVVFAGVRYMFSSADQKADLKKGLISMAVGGVLVFGAITIIKAVSSII